MKGPSFYIIASQEISAKSKQHIFDMQFNAVAVALKSWIAILQQKQEALIMITITVEKRNPQWKAKTLRRNGYVPASVYGGALPASVSL